MSNVRESEKFTRNEKTGAKSTDMQSPENVEHLCAKCDAYAAEWKEKAEELWNNNKSNLKIK